MDQILYYPYINVPRTEWTLRTLLYYDNIGSIVPQEYFNNPNGTYDEFMLELVRAELVTPIDPIRVLNNPWDVTKPFIDLINNNKEKLLTSQRDFRIGRKELLHNDKFGKIRINSSKIHANKFDENIFYSLQQLGLAERGDEQSGDENWYYVETRTANSLMKFLAIIISAKTDRLPTTDYIYKSSFATEQRKRETILTSLIPFPGEIDLKKLLKFKEKHSNLLQAFRTRIELIVLDPTIKEGSSLFLENLRELNQRKEELTEKMTENKFNNIIFGTVCGLIGAYQGLAAASTTGALIGGLPGFANAVHSALQIEQAENTFDQSGLKFLALADKRLRRK